MSFKRALSFSALETIASRALDLLSMWIIFNALGVSDIAIYGLATSLIFVFNAVMIAPETALHRFQKKWLSDGLLADYLWAFLSFSLFKILVHIIFLIVIYLASGLNWFFYAVAFSLITQQIQLAEIARISLRMELQQRLVAYIELVQKLILLLGVSVLFLYPTVATYFFVFWLASLFFALYWLMRLITYFNLGAFFLSAPRVSAHLIGEAVKGYSLWTHMMGVMTIVIYTSGIYALKLNGYPEQDLAFFTVLNKVINLFFVVPMFLQAFVPVLLANDTDAKLNRFKKIALVGFLVALCQFLFFSVFGRFLGGIFGLEGGVIDRFYAVGIVLSVGVLVLNITRVYATYSLVKGAAKGFFFRVNVPACIVAVTTYPISAKFFGIEGLVFSMSGVLVLMSAAIYIEYRRSLNFSGGADAV